VTSLARAAAAADAGLGCQDDAAHGDMFIDGAVRVHSRRDTSKRHSHVTVVA